MSSSASNDSFFSSLFGFSEQDYPSTKEKLLQMAHFQNVSHPDATYRRELCDFTLPNGRTVSAGIFSMPSVGELRAHVQQQLSKTRSSSTISGEATSNDKSRIQLNVQNVVGESRSMHSQQEKGAIYQAASQFNLLEFPAPTVVPEAGITGYIYDRTQGPACAIACAAGTAYRNYLVPVPFAVPEDEQPQQRGQSKQHQLNGLEDMEDYILNQMTLLGISEKPRRPWKVKNGYIESSSNPLQTLNKLIKTKKVLEDYLISLLRIGVQEDTAVTDVASLDFHVTQTYNSAISIGYSLLPDQDWEPMARIVLKGTYEATILVGILKALEAVERNEPPPPVYLTKVGGGVFRNKDEWIIDAMRKAVASVDKYNYEGEYNIDLDIRIVHYGQLSKAYRKLEHREMYDNKLSSEL